MATTATKPVRVFRLKGVKVAVFENRAGDGVFYKTSLQRVYKDGDQWKTTTSLSRDDLPVARLLLGRAWEWILEAEAGSTTSGEELSRHAEAPPGAPVR